MIKHLLISSVLTNLQDVFAYSVADKLDASIFRSTANNVVLAVSFDVYHSVRRSVASVSKGHTTTHAAIIIKSYDT